MGSFLTNATPHIYRFKVRMSGNDFLYRYQEAFYNAPFRVVNAQQPLSYTTVGCSGIVPLGTYSVISRVDPPDGSTAHVFISNSEANDNDLHVVVSSQWEEELQIVLNSSREFRYKLNSDDQVTADIDVKGFWAQR